MRAVVVRRFGGPEVLEFAEVPVPEPGPGQVRIRVAAAAVNPVDLATRSGVLSAAGVIPAREVLGLGWDVAGEIDAVGLGRQATSENPRSRPGERAPFRAGDAVIGLRDRIATPLGAYAGYLLLDSSAVAPAPAGASPAEAATLPLNALTAAQALDLVETTGTVLVTGAAGAVGGYAVALAHARKLRVVAVASETDEPQVRALGADEFVPRGPSLGDRVRALVPGGVDAALDTALLGLDALDAVRGGGEFVAFAAGAAPLPLRGVRVRSVWIRADGERLAELARLAENGTLPLRVAGVLPLTEAAVAHERMAVGGLRGRLVLVP
ncbi:NADPH:quinone reductase and related Zn-dependent oxidoreductase [Amycolatopsis mediterranei S699]|uniref:NADPH:quinone reductase and related Zn-dependent oxidoreductase n=2 Tax=Amycolatopsis mediterranei TaxID=33910 RepID=A0A0H3D9A1_AMYMU|nr:NADP-dependent oxidoreductase [Amycolatopsis mediterranei]ADJ46653.1 NADPH:quinone reductase and related Zn-dependent oxidoreductase [Amycolatopsis mediterranei U32]AEK43453.1 NADPH:quinone reductase and related Zn-dependent oxidoreductase [Amycolatopsis mediterranei S699]AFO78364.1 NADPH:quinone reductase and related Zn-dependent oxidoreductase [Amycolatopsis mediterranei S699]AGT85492.1 NADPH:quinone reductase-related Zn-dependent oxidoreductase [Amycolatopsis mediterranei RB]KDO11445.1 N